MDINKKIRIFKKPAVFVKVKYLFIAFTVLLTAMAITAVMFLVMSFMKVGDIEIIGTNPYDNYEIIHATQLKSSDNWSRVDTKALEQKLLREMKYLKSVEVEKKFPNKIVIRIEPKFARWYMDFEGVYYALDSDMYVIEEIKDVTGVTKLILPNVRTALSDEVPEFGQSEIETKETLKIIHAISGNAAISSRLTVVDVSDRTNIRLVVDGKYDIVMGSSNDIAGKLACAVEMLGQEDVKNSEFGGEINVSSYTVLSYGSFRKYTAPKK